MPNKNEENKTQAVQNEQEPHGSNIWEDASNLDKIEEADEIEEAEKPLSNVKHWADDQEQKIYNVYGSTVKHPLINAQKDALEAIRITPPENLKDIGEEFISMVTMGASINPDYVPPSPLTEEELDALLSGVADSLRNLESAAEP